MLTASKSQSLDSLRKALADVSEAKDATEVELQELQDAFDAAQADIESLQNETYRLHAQVEELKAQLKDFTGDKDQVIRRLNKALELAGSNRWRAEEKANAVLRHNHVLKKRVKELENLPIAMD